jgi:hypothetical protein
MAQPAPAGTAAVLSGLKPSDQAGGRFAAREQIDIRLGRIAHNTVLAQREADEEAARLTRLARYDDRFSCEWWPTN